jgi:HAD superfamily hydrolase (TIGR01509 family)
MGDILYDATVWRRWLWRLLSHMGIAVDYRCLFELWDRNYLAAVQRGERDYPRAFREFLGSLGLRPGQVDEVEAASHAQRRQLEEHTRAYPGVAPTLDVLRSVGVRLAVLSDSESAADQLRERLRRLGLAGCFAAVVSSFDLRHTKPAPICYQTAVEAIGLSAAECGFVGHDAEELAGAATAGLRTLALNYEPEVVADVYLDRFEQLIELVRPAGNRDKQVA